MVICVYINHFTIIRGVEISELFVVVRCLLVQNDQSKNGTNYYPTILNNILLTYLIMTKVFALTVII